MTQINLNIRMLLFQILIQQLIKILKMDKTRLNRTTLIIIIIIAAIMLAVIAVIAIIVVIVVITVIAQILTQILAQIQICRITRSLYPTQHHLQLRKIQVHM